MRFVRANAAHAAALRRFTCAGPAPFEQEVEAYIRDVLPRRLHMGVLLLLDGEGALAGVGSHEATADPYGSGRSVTYLRVVAIERRWQGRSTEAGPVSNLLLSALINDALATDREPLVTALVDAENVRSLRLLARPPFQFREDPIPELRIREDGSIATYRYLERRFARIAVT